MCREYLWLVTCRHGSVKRVASGVGEGGRGRTIHCTSIWPKCSDPVAGKVQSEFGKAAKRMTELADKARVEALIPSLRKGARVCRSPSR